MKRLFFCLLVSWFTANIYAQNEPVTVLFPATPDMDGTYEIGYGSELGILEGYIGTVLALYDSNRPLDDHEVGEATVLSIDEDLTVVRAQFIDGFSPEDEETILVGLAVKPPNPYYRSVPYEFTTFGITLTDLEDETLLDISFFVDDGLFAEHMVLSQLEEHLAMESVDLRDYIEDQTIEKGRYQGKSMFDAMETSTPTDIRNFLLYVLDNPLAYMGKTWKLAEIYATWLVNGTMETESPRPFVGKATAGFALSDPAEDGYPQVTQVSQAFFGMTNDALLPGSRLLSIDETSFYNTDAAQAMRQLQGELYDIVTMKVLSVSNEVNEFEIALMPLPDEAGWFRQEPEDFRPQLFPIRTEEDKLWGFVDAYGEVIIEPQYDDLVSNITSTPFSEGLEGVEVNGDWGFINLEGRMVISPQWKDVDGFSEGFAGFQHPEDARIGIIGGRTGYIDKNGSEIIAAIYDKPFFTGGFSEGFCAVGKDDKSGFIDRTGQIVIPFQFEWVEDFSDGLAKVRLEKGDKYGFIDKDGDWVIQPMYEVAYPFYNGRAIVAEEKKGTYKAINKSGNTLFTFDMMPLAIVFSKTRISDNRIRGWDGEKYGFMDGQGNVVIPAKYVDTEIFFSEGLIGVTESGVDPENELLWEKEGGWYFIDQDGNTVIEGPFEKVRRFTEGVCWVKPRGDRWGLIDKFGEWIIEPEFENGPLPFKYGISQIRLDKDGNSIFPDKYYMYYKKEGYAAWRPFY